MKKYTSIALIGALVVGMAGFISLDAFSSTSFATIKVASDVHETGKMLGHVTYELRDADGNIKHYSQSDNVIVDIGTDCAAAAIFDTDDGVCPLSGNGGFAFIAIGNSTTPDASATDIALDEDADGNGEVARSPDILDAEISAADSAATPSESTTVSIASDQFSFETLGSDGTVITQSGLFDSAGPGGNMFSIRDIQPGTGLQVFNQDTLSVTWTITLE